LRGEAEAIQRKTRHCEGGCLKQSREKKRNKTMQRGGAVYIMANERNGTLYTGVTSNLRQRVWEHRNNVFPSSFTSKYSCYILVYYNSFYRIEEAIAEEKRLKAGSRKAKLKLIEEMNPQWNNLWTEIEDWTE
jgi:putative endonuclease